MSAQHLSCNSSLIEVARAPIADYGETQCVFGRGTKDRRRRDQSTSRNRCQREHRLTTIDLLQIHILLLGHASLPRSRRVLYLIQESKAARRCIFDLRP